MMAIEQLYSRLPICPRCGGEREFKYRQRFCRACALRRMERWRNLGRFTSPRDLTGARDRLAAFLDTMPASALIQRLADLFGETTRYAP